MAATPPSDKVKDKEYTNWLKVTLALDYMKSGLHTFIQSEVDCLHQSLVQKIYAGQTVQLPPCATCDASLVRRNKHTRDWEFKKKCKSSCNIWFCELLALHNNPKSEKIYWANSEVSSWPFNSWECAKVFLPRGQQPTNNGPAESDAQALLTLLANCTHFHSKLSQQGQMLTHTISTIRNRVMHDSEMKLSDADGMSFIQQIIQLLEDHVNLMSLEDCKAAVNNIHKIGNDSVAVFFNVDQEMTALRAVVNEIRLELGLQDRTNVDSVDALKEEYRQLREQLTKRFEDIEQELKLHGERLRAVEKNVELHGERLGAVEGNVELHGERLGVVEGNVELHGERLGAVEKNVELHGQRLGAVEKNVELHGERLGAVEGNVELHGERLGAVEGDVELHGERLGAVEGNVELHGERLGAVEENVELHGERLGAVEGNVELHGERLGAIGVVEGNVELHGERLGVVEKNVELHGEWLGAVEENVELHGERLGAVEENVELHGERLGAVEGNVELHGERLGAIGVVEGNVELHGERLGVVEKNVELHGEWLGAVEENVELHGERLGAVEENVELHGERLGAVEENVELHGEKLGAVEENVELHGERLGAVEKNVELHGERFGVFEENMLKMQDEIGKMTREDNSHMKGKAAREIRDILVS